MGIDSDDESFLSKSSRKPKSEKKEEIHKPAIVKVNFLYLSTSFNFFFFIVW